MKNKNNASEFRRTRLIELLNMYKTSGKAKSVAALAKQYDLDTSYISQLRTGRSHFGETAARNLEAKLQLPARYFEPEVAEIELQAHEREEPARNVVQRLTTSSKDLSKLISIPYFDAHVACGPGVLNVEHPDVIGIYEISEEFLAKLGLPLDGEGLVLVSSSGESMKPSIPDQTPLLVNTKERDFSCLVTGKVYVFCADGQMLCKRIYRNLDNTIILHSDNEDKDIYPDVTVDKEQFNEFHLLGRVKFAFVEL